MVHANPSISMLNHDALIHLVQLSNQKELVTDSVFRLLDQSSDDQACGVRKMVEMKLVQLGFLSA